MISLLAFVRIAYVAGRVLAQIPDQAYARTEAPRCRRRILVVRLDQLGDIVLTTPLFRELKRLYPTSHCTVVVQPQYKSILTTNRNMDEILPLHSLHGEIAASARAVAGLGAVVLLDLHLRRRQFDHCHFAPLGR